MRVIRPEDIQEVLESNNPGMALLRIISTEHPEYVRKRSRHYAEVLGCDQSQVISMLQSVETWQMLCREKMQHFSLDGSVKLNDPELSAAFAKTFSVFNQVKDRTVT